MMAALGGTAMAQQVSLDHEKSKLWIEGESNVNTFNCTAEQYESDIEPPSGQENILVEVDVVVESFECGKKKMNRDLYDALHSNKHPHISFEYFSASSLEYIDTEDRYTMIVKGLLTVAGTSREIQFPMDASVSDDGTVRATGKTELKMTDYNVEPPTALLGLVRVDNELTVHFELVASISSPDSIYDVQNQR